MTKIRPNIFLGHEYDAHMDAIRENKIEAVLNVAHDLNDPLYPTYKALTVKVSLSDDRKNDPKMVQLALDTLDRLVAAGYRVLIHCRAGMSRSPHILALHLSKAEGRSYDDIWAEIRSLRPEVLPRSKLVG